MFPCFTFIAMERRYINPVIIIIIIIIIIITYGRGVHVYME